MEETLSPHLSLVPDVFDEVIKGIGYSDNHGWIPWAWAALVRAGDVPEQLDESDAEYVSHVITLVALGYFYEQFHNVYAGTEGDDELMVESWVPIVPTSPTSTLPDTARDTDTPHLRISKPVTDFCKKRRLIAVSN